MAMINVPANCFQVRVLFWLASGHLFAVPSWGLFLVCAHGKISLSLSFKAISPIGLGPYPYGLI